VSIEQLAVERTTRERVHLEKSMATIAESCVRAYRQSFHPGPGLRSRARARGELALLRVLIPFD